MTKYVASQPLIRIVNKMPRHDLSEDCRALLKNAESVENINVIEDPFLLVG